MGFRIEDGTGKGKFAAVSVTNRLNVDAVTTPVISDAAFNGDAYSIVGSHTLQSSDTDENVIYIKNQNADKLLYLQSIRFATKTSTGVLGKNVFGTTRTSGGTLKTPVQLNRGSAKLSGAVAYDNSTNNLVLVTTQMVEFARFRVGMTATFLAQSDGAIILGPADTWSVIAQGAAGNIIDVSIFCFEHAR